MTRPVERLDRGDDPRVKLATTLLQQPAVRHLVSERVLEGVLEIRIERPLTLTSDVDPEEAFRM